MYKVFYKPSVEKDLKHLPKNFLLQIQKKIQSLTTDPFPYYSIKLAGTENLYRIRIGDYRVVYGIEHDTKIVTVHYVRHRRDVYRGI